MRVRMRRLFTRRTSRCKSKYLLRIIHTCLACLTKSTIICRNRFKNMNLQIRPAPEEVSQYQLPARFLGEIHIVLSGLIIACSVATIVHLALHLPEGEPPQEELLDKGFMLYLILTIVVSITDLCLSVLLICAARTASLERSLLWQRFTISLLIGYTILTLGFGVLLSTVLVILALIPSLIFKPFAIWVVQGFVDDLKELIVKSLPADPMNLLADPEEGKKSTTVFIFNKKIPDIVESKSLLTRATRSQTNMK